MCFLKKIKYNKNGKFFFFNSFSFSVHIDKPRHLLMSRCQKEKRNGHRGNTRQSWYPRKQSQPLSSLQLSAQSTAFLSCSENQLVSPYTCKKYLSRELHLKWQWRQSRQLKLVRSLTAVETLLLKWVSFDQILLISQNVPSSLSSSVTLFTIFDSLFFVPSSSYLFDSA